MPRENTSVCDGIVRDKGIQVEVDETGTVAVPLVRDSAGKVLENTELEVNSGIERARGAAHQPALPVGILLTNCGDIGLPWIVPARSIEVPALTDGDDLAQLRASFASSSVFAIGFSQ
jgi:hypothetical protein